MVTQSYTIRTVKSAAPPIVKMSQYDHGSRTITFSVVDGAGQAVTLTGYTVRVEGTRLDGHAFAEDCTVSGTTATFTDTSDMTNQAGSHPAELVIIDGDDRLGTMNFVIAVEPAAMDENADITEEDTSLFEQLLGSIETAEADAQQDIEDAKDAAILAINQGLASGSPLVVDEVADMTDTTAVYLYSGSETGYTAGDYYFWDGSAWVSGGTYGNPTVDAALSTSSVNPVQNKVVATEISVLKSEFNDSLDGVMTIDKGTLIANKYINDQGNLASYNGWSATGFIELPDTEIITIVSSGSSGGSYNAFYNSSKERISMFSFAQGTNQRSIPDNAKYMRLSATTAVMESLAISWELDSKKDIDTLKSQVKEIATGDITYNVSAGAYINGNTGGIVSSETFSYTSYIDVSLAQKIRYTRTRHTVENPSVGIAFYDAEYTFVSGITGIANMPSQTMVDITDVDVPATAKYVRLSIKTELAENFLFEIITKENQKQEILEVANGEYVYSTPSVSQSNCYVESDGTLASSSISCIYNPVPVAYGHIYRVTVTTTDATIFRINGLNGNAGYVYNSENFVKQIFTTFALSANSTHSIDFIVNDKRIKQVFFSVRKNSVITSIADIGVFDDDGLGLHTMPSVLNVLGAVKRARHFTDIEWTPVANLPRFDQITNDDFASLGRFADTFSSGVTYKGLPYSSGNINEMKKYGYDYGHIGFDAPLSAFMTSLANPNTFLYVKSLGTETNVQATAYGVTCDALVCYAINLGYWIGSDSFITLVNNSTVLPVTTVDALDSSAIEIGDIIFLRGVHIAIITDIVKAEDGTVLYIEVSEATTKSVQNTSITGGHEGGVSRRLAWNLTDFAKRFAEYTIYRYPGIYTKSYEQSIYVSVGDEVKPVNLYNNMPIIPFMGEGFVYKVGKIENNTLLSQTNRYAKVAVYKDSELFDTYDYAATLAVPFTDAGSYYAFLYNSTDGTIANMTERSLACNWSVVS